MFLHQTLPRRAERASGIGYSFLTNNPSKSIADYLHKLETLGIHATREEMYTTALATIDYIKQHYPAAKRLFLLGTPSMISEFEARRVRIGGGFDATTTCTRRNRRGVRHDAAIRPALPRMAWVNRRGVPLHRHQSRPRYAPPTSPAVLC
ncbi:MAG: hypothetical protein ACLUFW_10915 [Alistipes sp.]